MVEWRGRAVGGLFAVLCAVLVVGTVVAPAAVAQAPDGRADELVEELADAFSTPGIAAVTLDAEGVHTVVRGRDGDGAPVTADTRFRIGSMTKAFTAAAVMQFVDAGRVRLDQPVPELVPGFVLADPRGTRITVRQLLSHTSGLSLSTYNEYALPPPASPGEVVDTLAGVRPAAEPGTRYEYLNTNYQVAARIVEVLSGQDFGTYQREHLFAPLGMSSTTSTDRCDAAAPGLTNGHVGVLGVHLAVPEMPGACAGSGGIVSTAADMARWLRFQLGAGTTESGVRLLTAESLREMHTPQPGADGYGLGWQAMPTDDGRLPLVGHGGALTTFSSDIEFSATAGVGGVVLTNAGGGAALELNRNLLADLTGGPHRAPVDPLTTINIVLAAVAVLCATAVAMLIARAPRWARRRAGASRARVTAGLTVPVALTALGVALPVLAGELVGGLVSWVSWVLMAWLLPLVDVAALILVVGGVLALLRRTTALRRVRRADAAAAGTAGEPTTAAG